MKYYDIIANLHRCEHSPAKVAQNLNINRSVVSDVIHGRATSYNVASYISAITSIPLNRLFPDGRYNKPPKANSRRAANPAPAGSAAA